MKNRFLEIYGNNRVILLYDVANSLERSCIIDNIQSVRPKMLKDNLQQIKVKDGISIRFEIYDNEKQQKSIKFTYKNIDEEVILEKGREDLFGEMLVNLMKDININIIEIQDTCITLNDLEEIVKNRLGGVFFIK